MFSLLPAFLGCSEPDAATGSLVCDFVVEQTFAIAGFFGSASYRPDTSAGKQESPQSYSDPASSGNRELSL